ncbi:hypothetical protein I4U23_006304 [Adineta vaga]|nr:hypothetical protein I4U23_006304 [Adineta vaga]
MQPRVFLSMMLLGIASIPAVEANMGTLIGSTIGGILGLIILVLDIAAIYELLTKGSYDCCGKVVWILIIFFFPIGGLILYWCCARDHGGHESV